MPRYTQPTELTPFAQVLVDYMWNRRSPTQAPLGVAQLAARLGVPRQNVNNWIVRGTVPTFEVILAVLARLDIPLRVLYDAYQRAGLTVPRWDEHDTAPHAPASSEIPPVSRSRKPTAIQLRPDDDDGSARLVPAPTSVPVPRPYIPPARPYDPEAAEAEEWDRMIAQAQAVMRAEGASDDLVQAVAAHIRSVQHGTHPMERHIRAEHSEPADEQPKQQPGQSSTRKSPSTARK